MTEKEKMLAGEVYSAVDLKIRGISPSLVVLNWSSMLKYQTIAM